MSRITYSYNLVRFNDGAIRTFLPVNIYNPFNNRGIINHCLVDTGADATLINGNLAINLGHDLKGDGVVSDLKIGIKEEKVQTWKHSFILQLLDPTLKFPVWESNKMLFECIESSKLPVLLGVRDFLGHFRIIFDYPRGEFIIEI